MVKKAIQTASVVLVLLTHISCGEEQAQHPTEVKSLCSQVVDKIAVCLGARVPLNTCSEESANFILRSECDAVLRYLRGEDP